MNGNAMFSRYGIFVLACVLVSSVSTSPRADTMQRGVCWVAATEPVELDDLKPLLRNHVNWISQTTFGWHHDAHSPEIELNADSDWWGENDLGIAKTAKLARQVGIKTLLKPQVWGRHWSGDIEMDNDAEWRQWFDNYKRFILHYARLAEEADIEALCIGTELQGTTTRESDWRKIIAAIRKVYKGLLVYGANWDSEIEQVRFWDALDFIGIQAYFPVAEHDNPSIPELLKGWKNHLKRIQTVHRTYGKSILFTEVGYRSESNAAIRPWHWEKPKRGLKTSTVGFTKEGLQTQANCYEAFFQAVSRAEWLSGMYIWKWHPRSNEAVRRFQAPFTPQGKPAEKVLRLWYGKAEISD